MLRNDDDTPADLRRIHILLHKRDREDLNFIRYRFGLDQSVSSAIRACIRAIAIQIKAKEEQGAEE
jgi:hypothetical protein